MKKPFVKPEQQKIKWECNQCLKEHPCVHETDSFVNLRGKSHALCFYHETNWKKVKKLD
jgi:hypothetical protein